MSTEIICRKCGRSHSFQEYSSSRFCRNCGTFLFLSRKKMSSTTPTIRISPRGTNLSELRVREHPKSRRADIDPNLGYFLGLFVARGILRSNSLVIRIPCKSENASDHRQFLLGYVVPRLEKATGEKIIVPKHWWAAYSFDISIQSNFLLRLLDALEFKAGEICRYVGAPHEIFNSNTETITDFLKGVGDCCGEVDRYLGGKARVVLRFLNENTSIFEDIIELLTMISVEIFDVNISPASMLRPDVAGSLLEMTRNLSSRYGVKVTGRQQETGRDNMIRLWAEEYYKRIGFNHPLRQMKLLRYLGYS